VNKMVYLLGVAVVIAMIFVWLYMSAMDNNKSLMRLNKSLDDEITGYKSAQSNMLAKISELTSLSEDNKEGSDTIPSFNSARFSKPPVWLYTKTKKSDGPKPDEVKTSELTESFIRDKYRISKRDIETIKKFYPDKYSSWVSDISDQAGLQK
jgi:hypothetical protein